MRAHYHVTASCGSATLQTVRHGVVLALAAARHLIQNARVSGGRVEFASGPNMIGTWQATDAQGRSVANVTVGGPCLIDHERPDAEAAVGLAA